MVGSWPNDAIIVADYDIVCIIGWRIDVSFCDGMVRYDRCGASGLSFL